MRILHTSDWHLGRELEGRSRRDEQEAFLQELRAIVEAEKVDLVLVAGDVFDTVNPPAAAETLYYEAIADLTAGGRRGVVVVAGNHDNPERLAAPNPLAGRFGISILGYPKDVLPVEKPSDARVYRIRTAPAFVELAIPGAGKVGIAALAYPSEARLNELLGGADEREEGAAYHARVAQLFQELGARFDPAAVNVVVSHLMVFGGQESESERPIQVGSAMALGPGIFPANAQYVALGHLHRPQAISEGAVPVRYSGSPLSHSFSEASQAKSVVLVDAEPGKTVTERVIPLSSGKPLVRWEARGGIAEALRWAAEGRDPGAWIDLEIHLDSALSPKALSDLRKAREQLIAIRPIFPEMLKRAAGAPDRSRLPVEELFKSFYARHEGVAPDAATVELFQKLIAEDA